MIWKNIETYRYRYDPHHQKNIMSSSSNMKSYKVLQLKLFLALKSLFSNLDEWYGLILFLTLLLKKIMRASNEMFAKNVNYSKLKNANVWGLHVKGEQFVSNETILLMIIFIIPRGIPPVVQYWHLLD